MRPAALAYALAVTCLAARGSSAQAFPNSQPDAAKQWYLTQDNAWSAWSTPPTLATVKVAVIDSGIDAGAPAFVGQIAGGRSFVGGSWRVDTDGHGTFVAGIIAANAFNGAGVAGVAFNAKLLIAKVLDSAGVIPPGAEADAIRWAANEGARVINLSLGGLRDPNDPELARIGLNETEAKERGLPYRVARLPMAHVFRAITMSETRGFMKALIDTKSDRILGFTMFGEGAGEVMTTVQMMMLVGQPYTVLRDAVITHPTLPEGLIQLFHAVHAVPAK